ncbi:2-hydroxy-6-oxo-6-phenylhexa-2,4-dienoate hydrolase [Nocardia cerradoensis]|uniref:2-hydroxy-6-oxo-6-phenylhexa-2,4-dienoate hydrolase n=1 Tax=Nocardia cerradoensis TaxID=85688 RepID=A0A231H489_9NOCA|nr:alpha/beta hydrolase [Nocardia cerradoensis]OXR43657.1 2-hydroxy-6-oxo-6-phenylhexa-2,4-dienoate hydrolase [Nocardia cerradoensis]
MTTAQLTERVIDVWNESIRLRVKVAGSGPALVYLHPSAGLAWDGFLERLAQDYTVYAPELPGTSPSDPYAIHKVHDLWQLVLIYEEAIRKLDLDNPILVGQSFGGMLAAELAAAYPAHFGKLVLLDPIGLWRDDHPVANWITAPPEALPGLLFADPEGPAARAMLAPPEDPEQAIAAGAGMVWAVGCTGKFVWPIPDKGLVHRLHRISISTLIVWGEHDALISPIYADEFADRIADSSVVIIADAGHIPQVEQTEATYKAVDNFLR